MKKIYSLIPVLFLFFTACQVDPSATSQSSGSEKSLSEDANEQADEDEPMTDGFEMKSFVQKTANYEMELEYPEFVSSEFPDAVKRLNEKIYKTLDEMNADFKGLSSSKESYRAVREISGRKLVNNEPHKMSTVNSEVVFYDKGVASFLYTYDIRYSGDKKSTYRTGYINYDLESLSGLRVSDLFVRGYEKELAELINFKLKKLNKGGLNDVCEFAPEQLSRYYYFTISDEHISFYYNDVEKAINCNTGVIRIPLNIVSHLINKKGVLSKLSPGTT